MEEKHNSIVYDDSKSNKLNIKKIDYDDIDLSYRLLRK